MSSNFIMLLSGSCMKECHSDINYAKALFNDGKYNESDICRIIAERHADSDVRGFISFRDKTDFFEQTSKDKIRSIRFKETPATEKETVMLFPGHGVYQKNMINILSSVHPFFERRLAEIARESALYYETDLFDEDKTDNVIKHIRMFSSELVIAEFWEYCGCKADILLGHSFGEYAAACIAGIISISDALYMIVCRNKLNNEVTGYQMSAIETSYDKVKDLTQKINAEIYFSAFNTAETVTVTADTSSMKKLEEICRREKINFNLINKSGGGHFIGLKEQADRFMDQIKDVHFNKPVKKIISTVYPGSDDAFMSAEYWRDHICRPVMFTQACGKIPVDKVGRMIDTGVSPVLLGMTMKNIGNKNIAWIPSVRAGRNYKEHIYYALGLAYNSGADIKLI